MTTALPYSQRTTLFSDSNVPRATIAPLALASELSFPVCCGVLTRHASHAVQGHLLTSISILENTHEVLD